MYYNTLNDYLRQTFGCKVYKLSLDGGMTCPNRDGTVGSRGCIFCSDRGSGEFAAPVCADISQQLENAKKWVKDKNKGGKYIAYFQNFTNTYAPTEYLRRIFTEAIAPDNIAALSIATRPDCLSDEVLALLIELNSIKPVWVELGLQTINPKSAAYIRRGYALSVYDDAMNRLKAAGIYIIVHQILCLPGENLDDMIATTEYIAASGANGIKLHLLHVLTGTDLAADYEAGKFTLPALDEYIDILETCIRHLPEHITIHRMTGDGAKAKLIAPMWTADKKRVLNAITRRFKEDDLHQGAEFSQNKNSQF